MPVRLHIPRSALAATAFAFAFAASAPALLAAQAQTPLPDAPQPQLISAERAGLTPAPAAFPAAFFAPRQETSAANPAQAAPAEPQPQDDPVTTMFPHTEGGRYWISGQANSIMQAHGHFHSPYEGANSLLDIVEFKASEVATLYLGYQLRPNTRYNTDLIADFENAGGRGISQALGLAGATNLDVVRNPNLSIAPYLSRGGIHQIIGLTDEMVDQERGPFALATRVPVRRFEIRIGKMSLPDTFDINSIGTDSHLQFMNWTTDNNGAWDYAADTRGYTVGGTAEYDDRNWSLRYGILAMPVVANGIDLDWAFSRARGQNGEFELRHSFLPKRKGVERLLFYANNAHMGSYRQAVQDFLNGSDTELYGVTVPTITLHERYGALKYGVGYNMEQELTENLRVGGRFGWNEGQHESFAYTEVDQTVELCADYAGARWHRPVDKVGLAVVSNAIKRDHQNYLHYGGLGFLLGDGNLNYGRENIVESYYTVHAWRGVFYAVDMQHIADPGYNRDRGPAWVSSVRMHVDF